MHHNSMITAKEAFSISNIINTPKARKVLEDINKCILNKAVDGEFSVDITKIDYIPAVISYLQTLGYILDIVRGDYDEPIQVVVKWSSQKELPHNNEDEGNSKDLSK